jgi:hypothetical protein
MRPPRGRSRGVAVAALAGLLAACQPLPHPFADDRPPEALLRIRDTAGVSIAPIEGHPGGVAAKLGGAMAAALLKRDIPASSRTTSLGSYLLYGRVVAARQHKGRAAVTALWRLYDSRGTILGERRVKLEAKTAEWAAADDAVIARLAEQSAAALAPLLADEAPKRVAQPVSDGRVRVAVRTIRGAPGDGGKSLGAAVAAVLRRGDIAIVGEGGKADLYIEGEVTVSAPKQQKQHVKIVWRVRRADGAEIGKVEQENDIPGGLLDGPWGDIAYTVAISASEGLAQLIARGTPPPKS